MRQSLEEEKPVIELKGQVNLGILCVIEVPLLI